MTEGIPWPMAGRTTPRPITQVLRRVWVWVWVGPANVAALSRAILHRGISVRGSRPAAVKCTKFQ